MMACCEIYTVPFSLSPGTVINCRLCPILAMLITILLFRPFITQLLNAFSNYFFCSLSPFILSICSDKSE